MSLGILLDTAASGHGDRIALGPAGNGITFAQLSELAAGGGAVIAAQPVGHVVMLGPDDHRAALASTDPKVRAHSGSAGMPVPPPNELKSHGRGLLRGSRTPDTIVWRAELPHTPTGKLLHREIVADVSAELVVPRPTMDSGHRRDRIWN